MTAKGSCPFHINMPTDNKHRISVTYYHGLQLRLLAVKSKVIEIILDDNDDDNDGGGDNAHHHTKCLCYKFFNLMTICDYIQR
jgi:hypothetical protein